jgi:hypothetical protein
MSLFIRHGGMFFGLGLIAGKLYLALRQPIPKRLYSGGGTVTKAGE